MGRKCQCVHSGTTGVDWPHRSIYAAKNAMPNTELFRMELVSDGRITVAVPDYRTFLRRSIFWVIPSIVPTPSPFES